MSFLSVDQRIVNNRDGGRVAEGLNGQAKLTTDGNEMVSNGALALDARLSR